MTRFFDSSSEESLRMFSEWSQLTAWQKQMNMKNEKILEQYDSDLLSAQTAHELAK